MTKDTAASTARSPIVIERSYDADIEDLWALWTTKNGFESRLSTLGWESQLRKLPAALALRRT